MGRTSAAKSAKKEDVIKVTSDTAEEMNEEVKETTEKTIEVKPLEKSDEIKIVSLVPNVSYKDSKTYDVYKWDEVGHFEYMTVETLDNMWRSNKGYFRNLWLKPEDDRVIKRFGLGSTYEKYEYLMDGSNYTKKNIGKICDAIVNTPNALKLSICDKVKNLVIDAEVTDVFVIRELENRLKIKLIDFL